MEFRRVVITGVGTVNPLGNSVDEYWKNLINGVSGAGPITHFDASLHATKFACEVKNFDAQQYMERKDIRKYDLYTQYAFAIGPDDNLLRIIASAPVRYEQFPTKASIICFFVMKRGNTECIEIISSHKNFDGDKLVSQSIQTKEGVHRDQLDGQIDAILEHLAARIRKSTGCTITWHQIALAGKSKAKQLATLYGFPHLTLQQEPTTPLP